MNIHDYKKIRWRDTQPIVGIDGLYHQVIEIRNLYNGRIYVSTHSTSNPNDEYMGSGTAITKAYKRFGKNAFMKRVLHYAKDVDELRFWERIIVDEEFVRTSHTYNVYKGGGGRKKTTNKTVKVKKEPVQKQPKEVSKPIIIQQEDDSWIISAVTHIVRKVKAILWYLYNIALLLI